MLIHKTLQQREALIQELIRKGELVNVVVATKDISRESTITEDMVKMEKIHNKSLQPGDLDSLESVVGKFVEVDILAGQHINANQLRAGGLLKYLSQGVPEGMRAITAPVDPITSIEGLAKPGDFVDVIGVFNLPTGIRNEAITTVVTLFQGVKVLATGKNISQYKATGGETVTLALLPEDAKILAYVLEMGKIRLVLRRATDSSKETGYTAITMEALLMRLGLWRPQTRQDKPETIKIYRKGQGQDASIER
jgi:Flp pilus assembly protein CpaB